jgi:hypothetical protein
MSEELIAAFSEFNDAAISMSTCQLAQVTEAAQRLEAARKACYKIFLKESVVSAGSPAGN